jgi:hypothetical protein
LLLVRGDLTNLLFPVQGGERAFDRVRGGGGG